MQVAFKALHKFEARQLNDGVVIYVEHTGDTLFFGELAYDVLCLIIRDKITKKKLLQLFVDKVPAQDIECCIQEFLNRQLIEQCSI